ncbi:neck protein [Erwinia phage vB_EamM-Bue1]|uniref:Neck protein n=2 Tax=Nezavisimistyvirus TaxID=2841279 RepID=A0A0A0YSX9_9CAUD|nr:neck protein [Erwinia phage phiEa2809]YP_009837740.1 neck protein [Erwinia phage vB_EamM-Bue1]AIX13125.1 neck protein [Erwinia phage phiEa2809]AVO22978.1 neck protein [Erwinia phage vB_EamM-Bue1]
MATSKYFNYTNHVGTQKLIEDLVQEMIEQRGVDVRYIPRAIIDPTVIFKQANHSFSEAYDIEMYIAEYTGANSMLWEKFGGLTMQDEVQFQVSRRRWQQVIGNGSAVDQVPQEGDLIYLPISGQLYQVNKSNDDEDFYQFGKYYTFNLQCTLYHYGNEDINTGDGNIDDITLRLEQIDDPDAGEAVYKDNLRDSDNEFADMFEQKLAIDKSKIDFGD